MIDRSRLKLGKLPARADPRVPSLQRYLTAELPAAPASVDWSKGVVAWGVMANDTLGDCTAAGAAHAVQVWTLNASNELTVSDQAVIAFYSATCGYRPGDPSTDQGGVEVDVLTWWHNNGLAGHSLDAFATLDTGNRFLVRDAIWLLGGAYLGLELPLSCQGQDVWDMPAGGATGDGKPGSWGGHCVFAIGYDAEGLTVISWGETIKMTWAFFDACCSEAYGLLSTDWIAATMQAPSGFNYAALAADMNALQPGSGAGPPQKRLGAADVPLIEIKWHNLTIDITKATLAWAIGLIGAVAATRTGFEPGHPQTWLGAGAALGAALWNILKTQASNASTEDLMNAFTVLVEALRKPKS